MAENFPSFTFTTQEDWYGELTFLDADNSNAALSLAGRKFEMWITPASQASQGSSLVAPVKTLTMETGGGLSLKSGSENTLVFRVPVGVANLFNKAEYTADVLEVVSDQRYLFMPVRVQYGEPASLLSYISRFVGIAVTFASRRQPIITPVPIPGREGAPGATIITGTVPPVAATGKNGDYYVENRSGQGLGRRMWGPKTAGAWPATPWSIEATNLQSLDGAVRGRQIAITGSLTANMLPNGDFTSGRDDWSYGANDTRYAIVDDASGPNGNPYLRMNRGVTDSSVSLSTLSPDFLPCEENVVYEAYQYHRGDSASASGAQLGVEFYDSTKTRISTLSAFTGTPIPTAWTRRAGRVTSPAGTKWAKVRLYHTSASTTAIQDVGAVGLRRAVGSSSLESAALRALTDLIPVANGLPYYTAAGTAALTTLSPFARTLLDDTDATTALATILAVDRRTLTLTREPNTTEIPLGTFRVVHNTTKTPAPSIYANVGGTIVDMLNAPGF